MFWIHGGSHIYGSGRLLNGRALPKKGDIVLITINYRLGLLGYFYIPGAPANIGQLDQIAALQWVQDNIELFGGDPNDVTIFGESAGATSICTLMAMFKAKGLFKRAISQSGAVQPHAFEFSVRNVTAQLVLKELDLENDDLDNFRKLPTEKIIQGFIKAQEKALLNRVQLEFRPYIDRESLPQHPIKAIEAGYAKDIEFLIGTNLEEWKFWRSFEPNFEQIGSVRLQKRIRNVLRDSGGEGDKVQDLIDMYKRTREEINLSMNIHDTYYAFMTDSIFRIPSIKIAEAQSKYQKKTFMYLFNWKTSFQDGRYGAMHALEIPFVFGSFWDDFLFTFIKKIPETEVLSEKMMDAWIAFAKSGNPNHTKIPEWHSYDSKKRSTMIFDNKIEIWEDPLKMEREKWYNMKPWSQF